MTAEVSDAAVEKATGRDWAAWFAQLNAAGAGDLDHKGIVALLQDETISSWWRQTIAVEYERRQLGRGRHQRPDGYQVGVSRTIAATPAAVYAAFEDGQAAWLPGGTIAVSTAHADRVIRGRWTGPGGGRVDVSFDAAGDGRTRLGVNHGKLADAQTAEERKTAWRAAFDGLKAQLEG